MAQDDDIQMSEQEIELSDEEGDFDKTDNVLKTIKSYKKSKQRKKKKHLRQNLRPDQNKNLIQSQLKKTQMTRVVRHGRGQVLMFQWLIPQRKEILEPVITI